MADGLFLIGTDRGVGKTLVGVALVALLRERGVDATLMTPIVTGGSTESAAALLQQIGVETPAHLVTPVTYETLAAPYVASRVEGRPVDVPKILDAFHDLRDAGTFVVVEGGGLMLPLARNYTLVDLVRAMDLPPLIIARTGRGTLNHSLMTLRLMHALGVPPLGFLLNGYGQFGEGFAESLNPDVLADLAAPTPVFGTLEWRPEYQDDFSRFVDAVRDQDDLGVLLDALIRRRAAIPTRLLTH
jgi:dethiobiotin synthetase